MSDGIILAMPLGGEQHVTVLYFGRVTDPGQVSADALHALLRPVDAPQRAVATRTAHFGPDDSGTAFVHLLDSQSLHTAHAYAKALTGSLASDKYPDYKPHTTIRYYRNASDAPPADQPLDDVYEAPGLELWYGGVHYPLREAFPSADRPIPGAQWDPYRAGFSASVLEFYNVNQPRDKDGRWAGGPVRLTQVSTSRFVDAISAAHSVKKGSITAGEMLSPPDPHYLRPSRKFLAEGGKAGFVISKEGDLQQVFNASDVKGIGAHMIRTAIEKGAKTLDCFDGFLPGYYAKFGFAEVGREANWTPGGPDVVYMALKSQPRADSSQTVRGSVEPSDQTSSATTSSSSGDDASRSTAGPLGVSTERSTIALEFYSDSQYHQKS